MNLNASSVFEINICHSVSHIFWSSFNSNLLAFVFKLCLIIF